MAFTIQKSIHTIVLALVLSVIVYASTYDINLILTLVRMGR